MGGYAFFDVDHTIINGSTGTELAKESVKRGHISPLSLFRIPFLYMMYRFGGFDPLILEKVLPVIEGIEIAEVKDMGKSIFASGLNGRIYRGSLDLMEKEKAEGRGIVFATSSIDCAVQPIADFLGVDDIISTQIETYEGRITGHFKGVPAFGEGKYRKVLRFLEEKKVDAYSCSFYTDSFYDLPLMERVGRAVAVNPDRRLRQAAAENDWPVLRFSETTASGGSYRARGK